MKPPAVLKSESATEMLCCQRASDAPRAPSCLGKEDYVAATIHGGFPWFPWICDSSFEVLVPGIVSGQSCGIGRVDSFKKPYQFD